MRKQFFWFMAILSVFILIVAQFSPLVYGAFGLILPVLGIGIHNSFQKKKAILRNFPFLGIFRYMFEMIRPEIQQYFVESDTDGAPVPREIRSVVYQRAKVETDTLPFGTQRNVYSNGYEWIGHSMYPKNVDPKSLRVLIGGPHCKKPYSASIFNISAMSFGALSRNAVLALNGGAQMGGFYHNTGEGGLSPYHLKPGGDIVWQIGTGYFGCRDREGKFSPELFSQAANHQQVRMIEIKLSQGAKPSHGGILPKSKITKEIAEIRKVGMDKDVLSPPAHTAFQSAEGLCHFVQSLRELSGGKPIGFKLCVGQPREFIEICEAMLKTKITPDFITVDGGEGGTGAAPMEFSDSVGAPLEEGLNFVHSTLLGYDLRKNIKIIASGKVMTGYNLYSRFALGADLCNSARGMMLALGCIQARRCNTNHCPTGVATSNEDLIVGLDPADKKVRVFNFHKNTVHAFSEILGASGLAHPQEIKPEMIFRRVSLEKVVTYADLFPVVSLGNYKNSKPVTNFRSAA